MDSALSPQMGLVRFHHVSRSCPTVAIPVYAPLNFEKSLKTPTRADGDRVMKRERKAKLHEYYLKRRATMTPEQRAAERAYQREYRRKRRARMTPTELDAYLAYKRDYQRERQAAMTSEQLEAQRKYQREYRRKWRANRTSKQLDAERTRYDSRVKVISVDTGHAYRSGGQKRTVTVRVALGSSSDETMRITVVVPEDADEELVREVGLARARDFARLL